MSFSPRFSPDGQRVIMSLQDGGNSNIYMLDLRSRQMRQLTNVPAINTAPSFSPDGSQIVFESDRGGTQQIYVMNADGSNQRRASASAMGAIRRRSGRRTADISPSPSKAAAALRSA